MMAAMAEQIGLGVAAPSPPPAPNMAWVPGGIFAMGAEGFYPEEHPVHRVTVDGFWMDQHPVTVGEFRRFVKATGYMTVAERPLDPEQYPGADPSAVAVRRCDGVPLALGSSHDLSSPPTHHATLVRLPLSRGSSGDRVGYWRPVRASATRSWFEDDGAAAPFDCLRERFRGSCERIGGSDVDVELALRERRGEQA
jgi:formylglycine-generating enzyme required for sulfatase activity